MIEYVIFFSVGQGLCMLLFIVECFKCLIDFLGCLLLVWQIEMLVCGGVKWIDVVIGFMIDMVDVELVVIYDLWVMIIMCFNLFYKVVDNFGLCWIVCEVMEGDFLIFNGDMLVFEEIVVKVQQVDCQFGGVWLIVVMVDVKDVYDSDDMKVWCWGDQFQCIGKMLMLEESNVELIGFLVFCGEGVVLFCEVVCVYMCMFEGVQYWYFKVIDSFVFMGKVGIVFIEGLGWVEVDFFNDIEIVMKLIDSWVGD